MGNQVTIRVDSRLAYGLIAILAVVGIFVVGWWVGTQLTKPPQAALAPTAAAPANALAVAGTAPAGAQAALDAGQGQSPAGEAPQPLATSDTSPVRQVMKGISPVAPEDVPIGEGQPRIWIDGLDKSNGFVYDMGEIAATAPTEESFTVKNIGTGDLVIDKTGATCGCTVAVIEDYNLAPGATTTVRVTYDPNVNQEQGKFIQKQIQIQSNDPVAPVIEFTIEGDVASQ
jgi:hypothetical protein